MRRLIVLEYLDPASRFCLALSCQRAFKEYFDHDLFGTKFVKEAMRAGHGGLLRWAHLQRAPFPSFKVLFDAGLSNPSALNLEVLEFLVKSNIAQIYSFHSETPELFAALCARTPKSQFAKLIASDPFSILTRRTGSGVDYPVLDFVTKLLDYGAFDLFHYLIETGAKPYSPNSLEILKKVEFPLRCIRFGSLIDLLKIGALLNPDATLDSRLSAIFTSFLSRFKEVAEPAGLYSDFLEHPSLFHRLAFSYTELLYEAVEHHRQGMVRLLLSEDTIQRLKLGPVPTKWVQNTLVISLRTFQLDLAKFLLSRISMADVVEEEFFEDLKRIPLLWTSTYKLESKPLETFSFVFENLSPMWRGAVVPDTESSTYIHSIEPYLNLGDLSVIKFLFEKEYTFAPNCVQKVLNNYGTRGNRTGWKQMDKNRMEIIQYFVDKGFELDQSSLLANYMANEFDFSLAFSSPNPMLRLRFLETVLSPDVYMTFFNRTYFRKLIDYMDFNVADEEVRLVEKLECLAFLVEKRKLVLDDDLLLRVGFLRNNSVRKQVECFLSTLKG